MKPYGEKRCQSRHIPKKDRMRKDPRKQERQTAKTAIRKEKLQDGV